MRCPWCDADEDRVIDSRPADGGEAIRRRRECAACTRRYTTFERIEDVGLVVVKRDGSKDPFSREKLAAGIRNALADRPVMPTEVEDMVERIQARLRRRGPEVSSQVVGGEVLAALRKTDEVAYLRFASVYKDFEGAADFERELVSLQKKVPAKRRSSSEPSPAAHARRLADRKVRQESGCPPPLRCLSTTTPRSLHEADGRVRRNHKM